MTKRPSTPPYAGDPPPAIRQKQSPLERVVSSLTDEEHKKLDSEVTQGLPDMSDLPLYLILSYITTHSAGKLRSVGMPEALEIIKVHKELEAELENAWKSKTYKAIRELREISFSDVEILQPPLPLPQPPLMRPFSEIIRGFQQSYRGAAVDGFFEYLMDNEKKCQTEKYYAKFCSIVQSSGTGKTRLMCEASLATKNAIVLYMNLREVGDKKGFPLRDSIPAAILTGKLGLGIISEETYTQTCHAFFIAIFTRLKNELSEGDPRSFIKQWNDRMTRLGDLLCEVHRGDFFRGVKETYDDVISKGGSDESDMRSALGAMHDMLQMKCGKNNGPVLIIAIDEAHTLTPIQKNGSWRPSIVFCRAIADFRPKGTYWVVFASTTSRVADFAAPRLKWQLLFPPYTDLGWDHKATPSDGIPFNENAKAKYILGFGRALWTSLSDDVYGLLLLAEEKLAPGCEEDDDLAVLAQRFCIDVYFDHKEAASYVEAAVASHQRVCLTTTLERTWNFTMYPSEPFLSCAAAQIFHKSPKRVLTTLIKKVNSGLIDIGRIGELANRLIWLIAKDLYVRKTLNVPIIPSPNNDPLESELADCSRIRVIDYLEFMFGNSFWSTIGGGGTTGADSDVRAKFDDAYINFSHWVSMKSDIGKRNISASEFLRRMWQRTSAVQCSHGQPMVDAMVPMYYHRPNISPQQMFSQLFISVKLTRQRSESDLSCILRGHPSIDCTESELPWIAILVDYGVKESNVTATFTPGRTSGRQGKSIDYDCLRIYAAGTTADTFQFMEGQEFLVTTFQRLVNFDKPPEQDLPIGSYLRMHTEYGSTGIDDNMQWEKRI